MTANFNRHTFPSGGWQFYQPQTKWRNPMPLGFTFEQTVEAIIKHRLANKAIALKYGLSTDFNTVADELEKYTKMRLGIVEEPPPKTTARPVVVPAVRRVDAVAGVNIKRQPVQPPQPPSILNRFASVASSLKKVAVGVGTVLDCVEGEPVSKEEAERRASICVGCNENGKGNFTEWFTVPLSEAIRKAEAKLKERDLTTSVHELLGTCQACLCPLPLKVFCRMDKIKKHMIAEVQSDLPTHCWILEK